MWMKSPKPSGCWASTRPSRRDCAGKYGRPFGVVAAETRELAGAASQIGKSIQAIIEQLRKSVDDTSQELHTMSSALNAAAKTSRAEVDQALGVMTATEAELRRSVEQSAGNSEALANDIARAVIAMQFQDSMSQQVTHVVDTLREIEVGLTAHVAGSLVEGSAAPRQGRHDRAAELMAALYDGVGTRRPRRATGWPARQPQPAWRQCRTLLGKGTELWGKPH